MKKIVIILITLLFITISCKKDIVKEPKILVERDVMVNIIYDLSILEAMKSQTMGVQNSYPKATVFIKKKYKIDSLTFAQNTQYYAQDIKEYKKMYEEVKERLLADSEKANGGKKQPVDLEEGIIK